MATWPTPTHSNGCRRCPVVGRSTGSGKSSATGWVLQTTKPGSLLAGFEAERSCAVWADPGGGGRGNDAGLTFTLSDLRSLADGEVWAVPKPFAQARAMDRAEFARYAEASC
jgi:hypothetical protein